MKRWAFWFLLPLVNYFVFVVVITVYGDKAIRVEQFLSLLFWFWLWITALAVPIALVLWLVRGPRRSEP